MDVLKQQPSQPGDAPEFFMAVQKVFEILRQGISDEKETVIRWCRKLWLFEASVLC
jgi:hypothetical protein